MVYFIECHLYRNDLTKIPSNKLLTIIILVKLNFILQKIKTDVFYFLKGMLLIYIS